MSDTSKTATPPGSNLACQEAGGPRVRRDWDRIGDHGKALYLDAVETAVERGLHQRFAAYHSDRISDLQAHETCAFFLWHRRFLLSYENMLRSLETRFSCLTVPFWNIALDFEGQSSGTCETYATCNPIVDKLGGYSRNDDVTFRQFNGKETHGFLHDGSPIQNLYDDFNEVGIVRYDMWYEKIPDSANSSKLAELFANSGANQVRLWRLLHRGIHDDVHNTIGGFMRTTSSPIDPIFFPWHATIDMLGWFWEQCHLSGNLSELTDIWSSSSGSSGTTCWYSEESKAAFPTIALNISEMHLELDSIPVKEDPWIGKFFSDDPGNKFANLVSVQHFNGHWEYVYDSGHISLRQDLQEDAYSCIACPAPDAFTAADLLAETTRNVNIPTVRQYSAEELESIEQEWVDQVEAYWMDKNPNDEAGVRQKVAKVKCILKEQDRDTKERWAIDNAFVKQIVVGDFVRHSKCNQLATETLAPSSCSCQQGSLTPVVVALLTMTWLLGRYV